MQKKVAFIHHSLYPDISHLETMPFSLNSVISLAKMGWSVDLYLWEKPSKNYEELLPHTVTVIYLREPSHLRRFRSLWLQIRFRWQRNYCCVFGMGQIGAYIANIIAKSNQCPFIYFNDEFPLSFWGNNSWTLLEQEAVKNAAIVVLPDLRRFPLLCQELDISTKPCAELPNIPMISPPFKEIDWHQRLGIPEGCIPFLQAGRIDDGTQVPEILFSLPDWPENTVLILHNVQSPEKVKKYRQQLSHLELPGRVIWSYEAIPNEDLHSLIVYCAGNFALYRKTDVNMEYIGFASGKLMRSLACGAPVIVSNQSFFSFVEDYQLGVLITHPSEIPGAVREIIQNRDAYSKRCLDFAQTEVSFEKAWQKFCVQLKQVSEVDLLQSQNGEQETPTSQFW